MAKPDPAELEISLFGPGIGESVAVHIGDGDWIIVDSCVDAATKRPAALQYLEALGVNAATSVKLVVASHFHDDHIRGISEVLEACTTARFVCSAAFRLEEFWVLLEANSRLGPEHAGTDEFDRVLQLLGARGQLHQRVISPQYAMDGTLLHQTSSGCEVRALSPSSVTMTAASVRLGTLLPREGLPKTPLADIGPNELSLALWIRLREAAAILGGDLEERGKLGEGWQAVVTSPVRPAHHAAVFKVPHHGSPNAQHDQVWTTMLRADPAAILTPYARGVRKLPSQADLAWLRARTANVFVTSSGVGRVPARRLSNVDRILDAHTLERSTVATDVGHLRVRVDSDSGHFTTEVLGSAYQFL